MLVFVCVCVCLCVYERVCAHIICDCQLLIFLFLLFFYCMGNIS